jgi:hypothetical protein
LRVRRTLVFAIIEVDEWLFYPIYMLLAWL